MPNAKPILRKFRTVPDLTPAAARLWAAIAPRAPLRPAPADGDGGDGARRGVVHGHHAVLLEQPVAVGGVPLVAVRPQHQAVLDRLRARRWRVEEDGLAPLQNEYDNVILEFALNFLWKSLLQ